MTVIHIIIGLYRDVWVAAIASSRTRLATLTGAMCITSQCELRSLRVNSGMLNVIRIVTYYTLPQLESPTSSWIAMALKAYSDTTNPLSFPPQYLNSNHVTYYEITCKSAFDRVYAEQWCVLRPT